MNLLSKYRCWYCNSPKDVATAFCTKCEKFPNVVHQKYIELAYSLDKLQSTKNSGKGISCVQTIISFLNRAQLNLAINVYNVDGDKICGIYPDVDKMICQGFNIKPRYAHCHWQ